MAFIKGRQNMDGILIANKCVEERKNKARRQAFYANWILKKPATTCIGDFSRSPYVMTH